MSSRSLPHHFRDQNKNPQELHGRSRRNGNHRTKKADQNTQYRQDYPPFIVPSSLYTIAHVHQFTSIELMDTLITHVCQCREFSIDTECKKNTTDVAVIQIHTIPFDRPSFVIFVELFYLPPFHSTLMSRIRTLLRSIFRPDTTLFSWGPLAKELESVESMQLFSCPIPSHAVNLQNEFKKWYHWLLSQYEIRDRNGYHPFISNDSVRPRDPYYNQNDTWSLQNAFAYACNLFLDKSPTVSHWESGLDPIFSTLLTHTRLRMIKYAALDCLAVTYLHLPVLQRWTIDQLRLANIRELFQGLLPSALELVDTSIPVDNTERLITRPIRHVRTAPPVYDLISTGDDDSDAESEIILLANTHRRESAIEHVDLNVHTAGDNSSLHITTDHPTYHKTHRSDDARMRRNKKRNDFHRARRYHYAIVRKISRTLPMPLVKQILRRNNIKFTSVKCRDNLLFIGVKNADLQRQYEVQVPANIFARSDALHRLRH